MVEAAGAAGRRDERLGPQERLRRRLDFNRCYQQGRRRAGPLAVLHYAANEVGHPRLGITAPKGVGEAVIRHRLKRRVREFFRRWEGRASMPALDCVVHLRPPAATAAGEELRSELARLFAAVARAQREAR